MAKEILSSMPAPSWPAWSAAWPPPVCTRRSSSWWVITEPECSKRPSRMGGPFLLFRSGFQVEQAEGLTAFGRDERLRTAPLGLFVEALLHFKQAVVLFGIRHQLALFIAVEVLLFQQERNKQLLTNAQLLGRFTEAGEQVA